MFGLSRTWPLVAILLALSCTGEIPGGEPDQTCGDGVCSIDDAESCEKCPLDCGECGTCGDDWCEPGVEGCEDCPQDCGECGICGDGECTAATGEDCATCQEDCGECEGCGDTICDGSGGESCLSCPQDCGVCDPCGDDTCDAAAGETCETCEDDCGACDPCGDGTGDPAEEDCVTCAADCGTCDVRGGCIQGDFQPYWGNLHAHTHYSDGKLTPGDAFAHARGAGLDFMWVTDHRERLTTTEWSACRAQASAANDPGTFVAGCGFEMSIMSTTGDKRGHLNALFTGKLMAKPVGMKALYDALAACDPCVGQWNHPPWPGRFLDYQFYAAGKDAMRLMELSGGGEWDAKWNSFFLALRNGWTISPSANEDNHSINWGDSNRATGVWATDLSRTAIRKAVRQRRTFSAFDDTAWIKLKADDVCWMGSVLKGLGPTDLSVTARDKRTADGFRRIELIGKNGNVLAKKSCGDTNPCKVTFHRDVTAKTFFVAQAIQTDGGRLVSAPIWFEP